LPPTRLSRPHDEPHGRGADRRGEHRGGGEVLGGPCQRLVLRRDQVDHGLDGAVHQLEGEHEGAGQEDRRCGRAQPGGEVEGAKADGCLDAQVRLGGPGPRQPRAGHGEGPPESRSVQCHHSSVALTPARNRATARSWAATKGCHSSAVRWSWPSRCVSPCAARVATSVSRSWPAASAWRAAVSMLTNTSPRWGTGG